MKFTNDLNIKRHALPTKQDIQNFEPLALLTYNTDLKGIDTINYVELLNASNKRTYYRRVKEV